MPAAQSRGQAGCPPTHTQRSRDLQTPVGEQESPLTSTSGEIPETVEFPQGFRPRGREMKLPRLCLPQNGRLPSCRAPGQPWAGRSILGQRGRPTQVGVQAPPVRSFSSQEGPRGGSPRWGALWTQRLPAQLQSWPHGAVLMGSAVDRAPCQDTLVSPEAPLGHPGGGLRLGGGLAHAGTEAVPGPGLA